MRREVLRDAVAQIIRDLADSGMQEMFAKGLHELRSSSGEERSKLNWLSIATVSSYINRVSSYTAAELSLLEILGIASLSEPKTWQARFGELDVRFIVEYDNAITNIMNFLPRISSLLDREFINEPIEKLETEKDLSIQRVILTDEGASFSAIERVVELLQSVQQIYSIICEANQLESQELAIVGLDSGSEKSFDFLGLARLVHELRETLKVVYELVVLHKQNVTVKNLHVATETLTVIEKISLMEQAGTVTGEQASRMRHGLFSGLEKFAGTGAFTPEMRVPQEEPALAMRPQPRLLTGPPGPLNQDPQHVAGDAAPMESEGDDIEKKSEFSDEEIKAVISALRTARQGRKPAAKSRSKK